MKKSSLSIILILVTFLLTTSGIHAQKIGEYECKWHSAELAEDEEGLINLMRFDEKSNFMFLIANDEQNLYFEIILADQAAIQKVMKFGLTTWVNPEGKRKKSLGIQFPVSPEEGGEPGFKRGKGGDRKDMALAMMAQKNQDMVLLGFGGKGERKAIDPRIDPDFHGKMKMLEGGNIKVSLVLPLQQLGRTEDNMNLPLCIGFETGYLDLTRQGMPAGGGQGPGGGDPHGGGMHGGGGSDNQDMKGNQQPQQANISELASPDKLWISKVSLAKKQ